MPIDYAKHDVPAAPILETRDRFIHSALWNCSTAADDAVRAAFDRLGVMLPGSGLTLTMFQNSPSTARTVYALVLHTGPRADQRRYFRPGAIVAEHEWEVKRGRRIPYTEVVSALADMTHQAEAAG